MNKENILKVADAIEKDHIKGLIFDMSDYFECREDGSGHCGTAACIAGWAYIIDKFDGEVPHRDDPPYLHYVSRDAALYLGLARIDADNLFLGFAPTGEIMEVTAGQAVAVLRKLAEEGVIDWTLSGEKYEWQTVFVLGAHDEEQTESMEA